MKRLGEQSCKNQLFKVTNKGKPPRMFSLACNLSKTDVEFLPIGISSKKVRANNVDFTTIKITLKKVSGNNMDFSTKEITSKKYVETTWIFRPVKLRWINVLCPLGYFTVINLRYTYYLSISNYASSVRVTYT